MLFLKKRGGLNLSKINVGLLFGGKSPEHEVSILSARSVANAINKEKYNIIPVGITKDGYWIPPVYSRKIIADQSQKEVLDKKPGNIKSSLVTFLNQDIDVVFPLIHGPNGEDGKLQGLLELLEIPYVGTGVLSSALGMDKVMMKKIFAYHDLPQAQFFVLNKKDYKNISADDLNQLILENTGYPCFIKPANMGSSIGITRVKTRDEIEGALLEAFKYDHKIVIEESITGREIECSVLGDQELKASLPGEIKASAEYYDYQAKYEDDSTELIIPVKLEQNLINDIQQLAVKAFKVIDGKGLCRVDFFLCEDENQQRILINEVNTIPGFTKYSMYPKLWQVSGLSYPDLIDRLIQIAIGE